MLTIKANHKVRNALASLSDYFPSPMDAISRIDSLLREHGIEMKVPPFLNFADDEGRINFDLCDVDIQDMCCPNCEGKVDVTDYNNMIVFTWYKVRTGHYECIKYVS